jgi:uncharacterized RDD family membrane protein YckC
MQRPFDSGPAVPVEVAISEVPLAPVAVAFTSEPPAATAVLRRSRGRTSMGRRLLGWGLDLSGVGMLLTIHAVAASRLSAAPSVAELALAAPATWMALAAALAVTWSWVFVALWGRTPGMALTGQRLRTLKGTSLGVLTAFARALLSIVSAGLGLFGFVLALFDARGQTLHDKLCRCIAVVD